MVLRPLLSRAPDTGETSAAEAPSTAWSVVAARQRCRADHYWLISQPDHANLSGDLAANFLSPRFPRIDPLVARAIGVHDAGWAMFPQESSPSEPPLLTEEGKPRAFLEFAPQEFLPAWNASIDRAAGVCPVGGIIVSRHFCALGDFRLKNHDGLNDHDRRRIVAFLEREGERRRRLAANCVLAAQELDALLEVLQFCDLLSLYLCSGAQQSAEFPQRLTDRPVRISRPKGEDFYQLDPSPFQADGGFRMVSLGVTARYYPAAAEPKLTTLGFLLA